MADERKLCGPAWDKSITGCKHFGADPDGAYCGHPKSMEISNGFGAHPNRMSTEGHCTHGDNGKHELWEKPDA